MTEINAITNPHSPNAEEAVLGSIIIDGENLERLAWLQPEDFYIVRNAMVYRVMQDLRREGQTVDYITICNELYKRGQLVEIGGQARVMQLANTMASSLNVESYARIVQEKAHRRYVLGIANTLANGALDESHPVDGYVSTAMDKLARSIISNRGAVHMSEFVSQVQDEVEDAVQNPSDVYGITTGFIDWDKITGGLQRGEVLKLSGEPGMGKSLLAMQVLCNAAAAGYPGAMYQLEMSGRQVVRRRASAMSQITTAALRSGRITEQELPRFIKTIEAMAKLPIYVSDASVITTADIRADLTRLTDQYGIQVAVIDYEGLLADEPDKDDTARSKIISSRVHAIFKDLNIAGLVIDDMNKSGIQGTVKGQGSLAGSARKLHDADQIVIIRKGDNPNTVRLTWEKMREGEADRYVDLVKLQKYPVFENMSKGRG